MLGVLVPLLLSCAREDRRFTEPPPLSGRSDMTPQNDLRPGMPYPSAAPLAEGPPNSMLGAIYENNRWAVSEGKALYDKMNCSGCHFHGGGGIGPPLMDAQWFYGASPEDIYTTIVSGRPEGMPSYRGKIADNQVWQIVAYVRSMSALLPKDVLPSRDDHMEATKPEARSERQEPVVVPHP
jgi:cytochrome c oxidase cbb3-type subunit III